MKILDEVIKVLEYCSKLDQMGNCNEDCPYIHCCDPESITIKKDAFYFLKEYRETKKHLACLDAAEICGEDAQVVNNPPLTWEELKQMKGEPVWIVWDDGIWGQHWILTHRIDNFILSFIPLNDAIINYDGYLRKTDLGRTWNIYKEEIK